MRTSFWSVVGAAIWLSLSCSPKAGPEVKPLGEVPPSAFAVVGPRALELSLLEPFAPAERKRAARDVVRDALLRAEAEKVGPARAKVIYRGELARRLIEEVDAKVRSQSNVSEAELRQEYEERWLEFDRPRAVRTVHVFFPVEPPADDEAQYQSAKRVYEAVQGTHNPQQFGQRAEAVLKDATEYRFVEMPPLAGDGRVVPMNPRDRTAGGVYEQLAKAAVQLSHAGDVSSVVGTEDGYHVILATEVVPAQIVPFDEVREELKRAVIARKVARALDEVSKAPSVRIERRRTDIANLLSLVQEGQ